MSIPCQPSTNSMLRPSPRHTQNLKDPPLAPPLHQRPLRDPLPIRAPNDIAPQPALIQPHPLPARQQPDTAIEDIIAGEIDQRRPHLVPRNEEEIDAPPDRRAGDGGRAVPFGAGRGRGAGKGGFEEALGEEERDDGVEEDGAEVVDGGVGLGDDEVDVAGVGGAAAVGAHDGDVDVLVDGVDSCADDGAVSFDFGAGDAAQEVVVVEDADLLVVGEVGVRQEMVEGLVPLADPFGCLREADAVDVQELLEQLVAGLQTGVVEPA